MAEQKTAQPRDPTLREMRATLGLLYMESVNQGGRRVSGLLDRAYQHMAWLLDAYLFDTDETADDGGRS